MTATATVTSTTTMTSAPTSSTVSLAPAQFDLLAGLGVTLVVFLVALLVSQLRRPDRG